MCFCVYSKLIAKKIINQLQAFSFGDRSWERKPLMQVGVEEYGLKMPNRNWFRSEEKSVGWL